MTKHFAAFIEDTKTARPHEIDILSEVAPEHLAHVSSKSIEVERCGPEGCEIHAPLGKKNGRNTTLLMFRVEARDAGYPEATRYAVCDAVAGKKGQFECVTERPGRSTRHQHLEVLNNGDELISDESGSHRHFHRIHAPELAPAG